MLTAKTIGAWAPQSGATPRADAARRNPLPTRYPRLWPAALILIATVLIRMSDYGNPHVDFDEPFYLLVGDRMLGGALPYVDIWDRKPIGLFLIYAAIRLLGGEGFVQYQVVATLFAAATAWFIFLIARRWTSQLGAIGAAIVYLVHMRLFMSGAGQSETFFNLLTAGSAWLAIASLQTERRAAILTNAVVAMALCGLALQIKYMVLPQCLLFGLFFLWRLHFVDPGIAKLAIRAALFGALGLAPTAAALAYYAAAGEAEAFIHANFYSIFTRGSLNDVTMVWARTYVVMGSLPLALCAAAAFATSASRGILKSAERVFLAGWLAAALIGFIMVGNLYLHYFAPVLVPLAIIAAPMFRRPIPGLPLFLVLSVFAGGLSGLPAFAETASRRAAISEMNRLIAPHIRHSFVYAYDGPTAIYLTTRTGPPTRFVYPDHLNNAMERDALGIDTDREVERILAARPGAILFANRPVVPRWNKGTERRVRAALRRDYERIGSVYLDKRFINIFALRTAGGNRPRMAPASAGVQPRTVKRPVVQHGPQMLDPAS